MAWSKMLCTCVHQGGGVVVGDRVGDRLSAAASARLGQLGQLGVLQVGLGDRGLVVLADRRRCGLAAGARGFSTWVLSPKPA